MEQMDQGKVAVLRDYLRRLNEGESLDTVRADFVSKFKDVEASEIMRAEQDMIESGLPVTEVQKLCDVHAALFHGNIREEREAMMDCQVHEAGHPLYTFSKENQALKMVLAKAREAVEKDGLNRDIVESVRELAIHYAKKGDLLYPHLKVRYGISGPANVMWTVDDEIRDELAALSKAKDFGEKETKQFEALLTRAEEMIYKEEKILFPNCAFNFTQEEWIGIYKDSEDYPVCFGIKREKWKTAEEKDAVVDNMTPSDQEIVMPGGHMTVAQLTAMLNTLPMEITFVDERNVNCYFNEGPKDFKRPGMAIGREVFSCHPPKIEEKVRMILEQFRAGTLDQVPIRMNKNGKSMLVTYMAVRDRNGQYMGTIELVQQID